VHSPGLFAFDDQEGAAAPPGGGAAALPCLLSNNSDRIRVNVSGNPEICLSSLDRKRADSTRRNIQWAVGKWGTSTGVLTMTFPHDLTTKEAQKRRANFTRRVLKEHFGESITVREFFKSGRPHFHLVIDCKGDVTTGFDWEYYVKDRDWRNSGRKGPKPKGSLGCSERLQELHKILNAKAKDYHVGRCELTPVKKGEAIGFYLGGYLSKSLANKPADAKGTRAVNYSKEVPREVKGAFSWANESGWLWRAKLKEWASKHGCESLDDLRAMFGPTWAYHHVEAIQEVQLSYYPTAAHAVADGRTDIPPDAVEIVIQRFEPPKDPPVSPYDEHWLSLFKGGSSALSPVHTESVSDAPSALSPVHTESVSDAPSALSPVHTESVSDASSGYAAVWIYKLRAPVQADLSLSRFMEVMAKGRKRSEATLKDWINFGCD